MWGKASVVAIAVLVVASGMCSAQERERSVVVTTDDKYVTLPQGALVTLKTVAVADAQAEPVLPPGRVVQAILARPIEGKKSKIGDTVELVLTYPLRLALREKRKAKIPAGASISGHLVLDRKRVGKEEPAGLAFVADSISWEGQSRSLPAVVLAVKPPALPRPVDPYSPAFVGAGQVDVTNSDALLQRYSRGRPD